MENVGRVKKESERNGSRYGKRYGLGFKLRCVKLRLEEELPLSLLPKEVGASKDVISRWGEGVSGTGRSRVTESS